MPIIRPSPESASLQEGNQIPTRSRGDLYAEKAIEVMALAEAMKEPLARSDLLELHARYNLLAKMAS